MKRIKKVLLIEGRPKSSYQKRMKETGEEQILETDPECRTICTKEGLLPAYNIQTVVDAKHHLIASFDTTTSAGESRRMPA